MGRSCAGSQPARHIISVRVNSEEMKLLNELALQRGVNISTLLRQSLNLVVTEALSSSALLAKANPDRLFPLLQDRG